MTHEEAEACRHKATWNLEVRGIFTSLTDEGNDSSTATRRYVHAFGGVFVPATALLFRCNTGIVYCSIALGPASCVLLRVGIWTNTIPAITSKLTIALNHCTVCNRTTQERCALLIDSKSHVGCRTTNNNSRAHANSPPTIISAYHSRSPTKFRQQHQHTTTASCSLQP